MDGILILRNIPDDLLRALGRDAAAHGRTVEEEALARLKAEVGKSGPEPERSWEAYYRLMEKHKDLLSGGPYGNSVEELAELREMREQREP
ncbi:hypothetical protein HHL28_14990 [Aerophototrophica crusticola]|uniref:Antitoxin FitA-like ribbon-helix-helix domain-containing protein n=1 Tax=Aerophototrophica crusticola TaxID=1709002 RepID=A0A858RAL7_9PROT|nr:hypothetical protein HHL28_14990 [Rhodospirillaceae bacterium B3]